MLTVSVRTVDGGGQDWTEPDSLYAKLLSLRESGLKGRRLVDALLTDDWGPPPTGVSLKGELADGTLVDEYLPYT